MPTNLPVLYRPTNWKVNFFSAASWTESIHTHFVESSFRIDHSVFRKKPFQSMPPMSRPHSPRVEIPLTVDWNRDRGVCLLNDWGFMGSWARHIYLEDLSTHEERECWEKCKTPTPYPLLIGSFTKFPCKSKSNLYKGYNVSNLVKKRIHWCLNLAYFNLAGQKPATESKCHHQPITKDL